MADHHECPTTRPPCGRATAMIHLVIGFAIGSPVSGAAVNAMRPAGNRYDVR